MATYFGFGWMVLMGALLYIQSEDRTPAAEVTKPQAPVAQFQIDSIEQAEFAPEQIK
jgi:hypothetical protein